MRTNRHQYFPDFASRCANERTCLRRNVGASIVGKYNAIVRTAPGEYKEMNPMVLYQVSSCRTLGEEREKGQA